MTCSICVKAIRSPCELKATNPCKSKEKGESRRIFLRDMASSISSLLCLVIRNILRSPELRRDVFDVEGNGFEVASKGGSLQSLFACLNRLYWMFSVWYKRVYWKIRYCLKFSYIWCLFVESFQKKFIMSHMYIFDRSQSPKEFPMMFECGKKIWNWSHFMSICLCILEEFIYPNIHNFSRTLSSEVSWKIHLI